MYDITDQYHGIYYSFRKKNSLTTSFHGIMVIVLTSFHGVMVIVLTSFHNVMVVVLTI